MAIPTNIGALRCSAPGWVLLIACGADGIQHRSGILHAGLAGCERILQDGQLGGHLIGGSGNGRGGLVGTDGDIGHGTVGLGVELRYPFIGQALGALGPAIGLQLAFRGQIGPAVQRLAGFGKLSLQLGAGFFGLGKLLLKHGGVRGGTGQG